jgi:hypothetical protein
MTDGNRTCNSEFILRNRLGVSGGQQLDLHDGHAPFLKRKLFKKFKIDYPAKSGQLNSKRTVHTKPHAIDSRGIR